MRQPTHAWHTRFRPRADYGTYCRGCGKHMLSHKGVEHHCPIFPYLPPANGITNYLRTAGTPRCKPHIFFDRVSRRWTAYVSPTIHPVINMQAIEFTERLQHG